MDQTREEMLTERQQLKAEYRELFDSVSALFFRHDPIEINFGENTDEYEPEVGSILPRLRSCHSEAEVCRVVHEEFVKWFDEDTAGTQTRYEKIAPELWALWQQFSTNEHSH